MLQCETFGILFLYKDKNSLSLDFQICISVRLSPCLVNLQAACLRFPNKGRGHFTVKYVKSSRIWCLLGCLRFHTVLILTINSVILYFEDFHQIKVNSVHFPVDKRRRFNVDTTSYDIVRRRIDVETTLCVYWVMGLVKAEVKRVLQKCFADLFRVFLFRSILDSCLKNTELRSYNLQRVFGNCSKNRVPKS